LKLEELKIGDQVEVDMRDGKRIIKILELEKNGKNDHDTVAGILIVSTVKSDTPFHFDPKKMVWAYIDQVRRIVN
jgi:hypothetical protein